MGHRSKKLAPAQREKRLADALARLRSLANTAQAAGPADGPMLNIKSVAREFNVDYSTLRRRFQGHSLSRRLSHESQQLLCPAQEKAFVDWIVHLSDVGRPLSKRTISKKVQRILKLPRRPSRKWIRAFLARHPELRLGKPSGLDPKRAQAFNEKNVEDHFDLLRKTMEKHDIPWANVYNMDEKGIQRGGMKEHQYRYIVPKTRRPTYKLRSASLELVTVIECVCADGTSLKPTFVFPGKEFHKEWFEVDPEIL